VGKKQPAAAGGRGGGQIDESEKNEVYGQTRNV
jgi:hypothetical protein